MGTAFTGFPLWGAHLAAAEVRRNAERGVRAGCFSEMAGLDADTVYKIVRGNAIRMLQLDLT